ncbi:MAG: hypothetical protein ACOX5G_10235 [Kiritimatiellia bacterium]|jgi:hypothetical protein
MRATSLFLASIALLPAALPAATPEQVRAFAPYQAIIDRMPFGRPPPEGVAVAVPTADQIAEQKQQEELARKIGMCAVNIVTGGKVKVGFIDNSQNPAKNYYLAIGESCDGFTVVDASYEDESATLEQDGVSITLKLGQGLVAQAPVAQKGAGEAPAGGPPGRRPGRRMPPPAGGGAAPGGAPGQDAASYTERLRERRDAARRERLEQARAMREEAERAAEERASAAMADQEERIRREAQIDLVAGRDIIELTPDEEAALVEEGALVP